MDFISLFFLALILSLGPSMADAECSSMHCNSATSNNASNVSRGEAYFRAHHGSCAGLRVIKARRACLALAKQRAPPEAAAQRSPATSRAETVKKLEEERGRASKLERALDASPLKLARATRQIELPSPRYVSSRRPPTADALGGVVATTATVSPTASPHLDAFVSVSFTGRGACCRIQSNGTQPSGRIRTRASLEAVASADDCAGRCLQDGVTCTHFSYSLEAHFCTLCSGCKKSLLIDAHGHYSSWQRRVSASMTRSQLSTLRKLTELTHLDCSSVATAFDEGSKSSSVRGKLEMLLQVQQGQRCFVETGTNRGDTTLAIHASRQYNSITTIEKFEPSYHGVLKRFRDANASEISALLGDTVDLLPSVLGRAPHFAACVFWLDAHNTFASPHWAVTPVNPLLQELSIILAARRSREAYVVLDDYRLFGVNDSHRLKPSVRKDYAPYPRASAVRDRVCAARPHARFLVGYDTMHINLTHDNYPNEVWEEGRKHGYEEGYEEGYKAAREKFKK